MVVGNITVKSLVLTKHYAAKKIEVVEVNSTLS